MKTAPIDYVTKDEHGNEIARETGTMYEVETLDDLEALFAMCDSDDLLDPDFDGFDD